MPIAYHANTHSQVITAIENARKNKVRVKIYLGDTLTGKCWNEEHDIFGYVGLSKGTDAYFPILVNNKRSYGGGTILDHCIVKIKESKGNRVLYQAANFQQPVIEISYDDDSDNPYKVTIDGEVYSYHKTERSANLLKTKLS